MEIKKLPKDILLPSAVMSIPKSKIKYFKDLDSKPQVGDLVYGTILRLGQHKNLENKQGRIHTIKDSSKAIFVFGNRYAPDYYEGKIPEQIVDETDLLARSGLIGDVKTKSSFVVDPTRIKILGCVCDEKGKKLNTLSNSLIKPRNAEKKYPRSKLILVCGTAMNSGKSLAAAACIWALANSGVKVRGSKITGTASLKDILNMEDAGAKPVNDFTYLGFPSTYLLEEKEVLSIFETLDLKYANNPKNYWVVEIADGLNQRETAMLLSSQALKSRIHKLVFCANDAFGAIGGLKILKEKFSLEPDILSGVCSSSPLHIREIKEHTSIPVIDSMNVPIKELYFLLSKKKNKKVDKSSKEITK
jgi:hypothetical protein